MPDSHSLEIDFLDKITEIIERNISNEKFGVSELAHEVGMSRSNLLRKVKKITKLSVSQFIRQVRLKNAMETLKQTSLTVSEISYEVGFSSTSYFIKCFHDYYGYPPGEVGKRDLNEGDSIQISQSGKKRNITILVSAIFTFILFAVLFIVFKPFSSKKPELEKSIAVLPFKNDSNDSTNVHIINGLMESILNNLQKIEDLRVISRTSVEKYRNNPKTISEIGKELNVSYFIEGSGQKIDDKILLNIQLIEAKSDKHLWAEQYNREVKDIFKLQKDIANNITGKIQAIITPEEAERINKAPTDDIVAYDYYLMGRDLMYKGGKDNLEEAILNFKKAIEHDSEFARAYAAVASSYYFLDMFQTEKKFSVEINNYADKALLHDSKLTQSLIAKALFYLNNSENELAVPYLEKALEYNPNSALVLNILSDHYATRAPNTMKYLEYALKGIGLDIATHDSVTASFVYLHVSNALIQSGFIDEAEKYINKSIGYNPQNLYSEYVKAYILLAKNRDFAQTKKLLIKTFNKDTTRLDVLQEIGKICYVMKDYRTAYKYYKKFNEIREAYNLNIYRGENVKIAMVLSELEMREESEKYLKDYKDYADNDKSIYKHLSLSAYYALKGDIEKSIEHLKLFSQEDNYYYWIVLFLRMDPLIEKIKDHPEFEKIMTDIETKFWNYHKQIKVSLEEKELL